MAPEERDAVVRSVSRALLTIHHPDRRGVTRAASSCSSDLIQNVTPEIADPLWSVRSLWQVVAARKGQLEHQVDEIRHHGEDLEQLLQFHIEDGLLPHLRTPQRAGLKLISGV